MSGALITNILRFVGLVLFQVLILKNIDIYRYINIYIYPLFILLLPFGSPRWGQLLAAFAIGFTVGLFYDNPGEHAAVCTFIAFIRPFILDVLEPRGGYNTNHGLTKHHYGFSWAFQYASFTLVLFLLLLFILETFSISGVTLLMTLLSYVVSIIMVILYQYLFNPKT